MYILLLLLIAQTVSSYTVCTYTYILCNVCYIGDIVYYESARCLHGRMEPLSGKGSFFVNLFAHYRPVGDPLWYTKDTPEHHAQPLIDLTTVDVSEVLPNLSKTKEALAAGKDLYSWWEKTAPGHEEL